MLSCKTFARWSLTPWALIYSGACINTISFCRIYGDNYKFLFAHTENGSWGTRVGSGFLCAFICTFRTHNECLNALKKLDTRLSWKFTLIGFMKRACKVIDNCSLPLNELWWNDSLPVSFCGTVGDFFGSSPDSTVRVKSIDMYASRIEILG